MNGGASKNAYLNEQVTFIQNAIPGFEAGSYTLTLAQQLVDSTQTRIDDGGLDASYTFAVNGDRFVFAAPAQMVYSVFPPDASSGAYETALPHVVLTERTLPWNRSPTTGVATPDAAGDIPTWLTILTCDQDDQTRWKALQLEPTTGVIGDLFPKQAYSKSTLSDEDHSYFDGATTIEGLEAGQTPETPIEYLDVPLGFFWQIAPTLADLGLMAHVREVSLLPKPTIAGVSDRGQPVGAFAIVFGNRLARRDATTHANLVSLEGLAAFLPTSEDGGPPAGTPYKESSHIRLAVLKHWSFRATGQPATFVNEVMALNRQSADGDGTPITTLHLPKTGTNPAVKAALEMGYVPLDTDMRTAEKTISWYRGPLAPYGVTASGPSLPIMSPDGATVFDPTTGMFDMSFAAAWTVGRMIALQDTGFSVPLYQWKMAVLQGVASAVEARLLGETLTALRMTHLPDGVAAADASSLETVYHHMILSLVPKR